jgi:predicted helicase
MLAERPSENVAMMATNVLPDYHLLRPNAVAIPVMLEKQSTGGLFGSDEGGAIANLSTKARKYLSLLDLNNPDIDLSIASLLWYHALAIGFSPAYSEENGDGIRADFPRIPLPATRGTLEASAALGKEIATLLNTEIAVPSVTIAPIRDDLNSVAVLKHSDRIGFQEGDLAITAGWGNSTKTGVMPGRGKVEANSDQTVDVYLNEKVAWRNIPANVWRYTIGGYQVMKKWLSYREKSVLGRDLSIEEARELQHMARRIAAIVKLEEALNSNFEAVCSVLYSWQD